MKISLFLCFDDDLYNYQKKFENLKENLFKIGFDINYTFWIKDLLGIDYKNMGTGLKVFLEDSKQSASNLLISTSNLEKTSDGIYFNFDLNILIIPIENVFKEEIINQDILCKLNAQFSCKIFKTFGVTYINLFEYLKEFKLNNNVFEFLITENLKDAKIILRFSLNLDAKIIEQISLNVYKDLMPNVYADRDINLSTAIFEILNLRKLKISCAESMTSGLIANTLIRENMGSSEIINESYIVYSDEAKHEILGVSQEILDKFSAVSAETAFEMAVGLLKKNKCDIGLITTGYANHENSELNGLFYTAIGDKNAVHVYKNKFNGTRQEVIQYGVKLIYFQLLKKLRENTLNNINFAV